MRMHDLACMCMPRSQSTKNKSLDLVPLSEKDDLYLLDRGCVEGVNVVAT